ncbi:MAG: isoprenyl transferase [Deltaproteobacteria bacterium]|nr:isoprenyl transferase [Deltaproteobacteria bacterium]
MNHEVKSSELPRHVAIIMDGNGRWARGKGLRRIRGHREGARSVREVVRTSREIGIQFLTLYAFSEENWQRPKTEVSALMHLLGQYLDEEKQEMIEKEIRFNVIGNVEKLPKGIRGKIVDVEEVTQNNGRMVLNLALSYGGRSEIVRAARILARRCMEGGLDPDDIDEVLFGEQLYTAGQPDPDLLIRTSGELRISNFLLWQISYTELVMTPVLWPDFRREQFMDAISEYQRRRRRFGRTDEQVRRQNLLG